MESQRLANFIIGGTEKAGTTSVFVYLSTHPEVCSSVNKETDFFREDFCGDIEKDKQFYSKYFSRCNASMPIVMEASPGYLGEAVKVVPRMVNMVPDVKLLFILRDPIERLYSSFNFHVAKLDIPSSLSFAEYVDKCLTYDRGEQSARELGLNDWYLKTLAFGRYAESLKLYYDHFPRNQIKVMFFEQLKDDVVSFMHELSDFLGIDARIWDTYEFSKENVTFSGKNKLLHRVAMRANTMLEPLLRRNPSLKHAIVRQYKRFNQAREGYDPMSDNVRQELEAYYRPFNTELAEILGNNSVLPWSGHS
jgi:hypothetical protein